MDNIKISTLLLWLFYIENKAIELPRIGEYIKQLCNMGYLEVVGTEVQITEKGIEHLNSIGIKQLLSINIK